MSAALEAARKMLASERCPKLPDQVDHKYEDKFRLVEVAESGRRPSAAAS